MKKLMLIALVSATVISCNVSADQMAHWANVRDDAGNQIGTVDAYSDVQVCGTCTDNPGRTVIYDPNTGLYGSVASVYLYGGTDYEYENPTEYAGYTYNYDYDNYAVEYDNSATGYLENSNYYPSNEYSYSYDYNDSNIEYLQQSDDAVGSDTYVFDYDEGYHGDMYTPTHNIDETYRADLYQVGNYAGGELWVDVNLTAQTVSLYNGDNLIASGYCVTGMPGEYETPVGTHYVMAKEANAVLRGENPDGTMYECPVGYWMPFTDSGCGLHDATWRSSFGGDIWQSSGSYGCVNMEYGMAQEIFENVEVGTPVEVHW